MCDCQPKEKVHFLSYMYIRLEKTKIMHVDDNYKDVGYIRDLTKISILTEFWPKKVFHTFLYDDCEWEARCLYTYKYYLTNNDSKLFTGFC